MWHKYLSESLIFHLNNSSSITLSEDNWWSCDQTLNSAVLDIEFSFLLKPNKTTSLLKHFYILFSVKYIDVIQEFIQECLVVIISDQLHVSK